MTSDTAPVSATSPLPPTPPERIPSLDGWRGIAIILVLIAHQTGALGYHKAIQSIFGPVGQLGVRIFFVLSGFLVTHLLLQEIDRTGRLDLIRFWQKRILRLLPLAVLFMACIYAAAALGYIQLRFPADFFFPLTFTMNYYPWRAWYWVHLWSLSVQLQFYLLWPLLILAVGRQKVIHLCVAVMMVIPLVRLGTFLFLPRWYTQGHTIETTLDIFVAGALMAAARKQLDQSPVYLNFLKSPAIGALGVLILLLNSGTQVLKGRLVLLSFLSIALAVMLDYTTRLPGDWWPRLLGAKPLVFLGAISYAIYVWQQPLVNEGTTVPVPAGLAATIVISILLHRLVEEPIANWARKKKT